MANSPVPSADSLRIKRIETLENDGGGDRACFRCGKAVKPGRGRWVHVIRGGGTVLHPDDESKYESDGGDLGGQLLGSDCAKRLGLEWSTPESSSEGSAKHGR